METQTDRANLARSRLFVRGAFRRFFFPAVLSSFWLAAAGVADSIFVGNGVGARGLAAISFGQPVYLFFNILSYGFSIGGSIHYAAKLAEGREDEGNRIFMTMLRLLVCTYVVLCALGILFLPQLMTLLGADPADGVARTYIRTQLMFVPVMFCQGPLYFFVNADDNPKLAAAAMSVSGITDAVFSYIFVIRMGLGVAGSVYSTVVGAVLMLIMTGSHILLKKGALRFGRHRFDVKAVGIAARTGFATSVQFLFQFVTMIAVNRLLMRIAGPVAVAAFDVVYNISLLCASICDGTSVATEPMLSSYRSERNVGNIRITLSLAFFWTGVISIGLALVFSLFAKQFSVLFGMTGARELAYTAHGIRVFALSVIPAMVNVIFGGYYQSILREWLAYLITFLRSFVFYLTALYVCSWGGMETFWFVFVLAEVLAMATWIPIAVSKGGILQLVGIDTSNARTTVIDSATKDISEVIRPLQDFCEERGAGMRQVTYIGLTVEELSCAILDRFRDRMDEIYIQVTVVAEGGETTLFLRDNAYEFNPLAEDTDEIDLRDGSKLDLVGVRIVQKKAKEFYYRRYTGFNTLVIRL